MTARPLETAVSASPHVSTADAGLARHTMGTVEVLGQSVAAIAPSAVMATGPALVVLSAGNGAWLSYALGLVVVLVIGYCVCQFARQLASPGSLYSYVAKGLGPAPAFAAGWGLLIGYTFIAIIGVVGVGIYFGSFLTSIHLTATGRGAQIAMVAFFTALAAAMSIMGIRISVRVGLVLEILSISAVSVVLVVTLFKYGLGFGSAQFHLRGVKRNGVTFGMVLAILGFVGFESSASLGAEASHPYRAIPRAVLLSAAVVGALYVFAAYTSVLGFGGPEGLGKSQAPMSDLAHRVGIGGFSYVVDLGVAASFFAVAVASINAASRVLFTMGREGVLPAVVGRAHPEHKTPHIAILSLLPIIGLVPIVMLAYGTTSLNIYAYTGTIGTFGYLLAYLLTAVGLPLFLGHRRELTVAPLLAAIVATVAIIYVVYKNLVPVPASPYNVLPYLFLVLMLAGMAWFGAVWVTARPRTQRVGSFEDDLGAEAGV